MDKKKLAEEFHDAFETILSMQITANPVVFTHKNTVEFSPNSTYGGMSELLYNDEKNCVEIFTRDDWDEVVLGAEEHECKELRVKAILDVIERV